METTHANPVPSENATDPRLVDARERFVDLWSRMGSTWGIPRTMAEVHALLFLSGDPMNTDDVMAALDISRGNASMTLRRLVEWGIATRVHLRGDRKEYFQAEQDVWEMFRNILAQRKKLEVDPLLDDLAECRRAMDETRSDNGEMCDAAVDCPELAAAKGRIDALSAFLQLVDAVCESLIATRGEDLGLAMAARMLSRLDQIDLDRVGSDSTNTDSGADA